MFNSQGYSKSNHTDLDVIKFDNSVAHDTNLH